MEKLTGKTQKNICFSRSGKCIRVLAGILILSFGGMFSSCAMKQEDSVKPEKEEQEELPDNRYPNYEKPSDPNIEELEFKWRCEGGSDYLTVVLDMDVDMYEYYASLDRFLVPLDGHMSFYNNDENNRELLKSIAEQIKSQCDEYGFDESQYLLETINFVQSIPYKLDSESKGVEDYSKYPIETLYERNGDCEDSSILLAGIVRELGYDVIYIWYLDGHMAVGIKCDGYDGLNFEYEGEDYYYIETTGTGWNIGEEPQGDGYTFKYVFPLTEDPDLQP